MNMMSMVLVALVAFTYFGGQNVPKVLKDNKQMLLGVFVGVLLHQFMGIGVEGGPNCAPTIIGSIEGMLEQCTMPSDGALEGQSIGLGHS